MHGFLPVGAADFEFLDLGGWAEAEMEAEGALGDVGGAGAEKVRLWLEPSPQPSPVYRQRG